MKFADSLIPSDEPVQTAAVTITHCSVSYIGLTVEEDGFLTDSGDDDEVVDNNDDHNNNDDQNDEDRGTLWTVDLDCGLHTLIAQYRIKKQYNMKI